jgi:hypothetical protein
LLMDLCGKAAAAAAKLMEGELIEWAQHVLDAMGLLASKQPDPIIFQTVRKLDHSGLQFQTTTIKGAE